MQHAQLGSLTHAEQRNRVAQLCRTLEREAVDRDHDVAGLDAGVLGGRAVRDLGDPHAVGIHQAVRLRLLGTHIAELDSERPALD